VIRLPITVKMSSLKLKRLIPQAIYHIKSEAAQILMFSIIEVFMQQGLPDEQWKQLSAITVEKKHSRSILIDKGFLMNSITVGPIDVDKPVEVGIFEGPALRYAWIHEFGGTIPVTDSIRKFFIAKTAEERRQRPGLPEDSYTWHPLRNDTNVISIPARPFMRWGAIIARPKISKMAERVWYTMINQGLIIK